MSPSTALHCDLPSATVQHAEISFSAWDASLCCKAHDVFAGKHFNTFAKSELTVDSFLFFFLSLLNYAFSSFSPKSHSAHCSPAGVWFLATLAVSLHLSVFSHTARHLCVLLCASITSCPPGPLYVSQPLVRLSQDHGRSLQSAAWACLLHDALSSSVHVSVSFLCGCSL